jgi:hypothetical protein
MLLQHLNLSVQLCSLLEFKLASCFFSMKFYLFFLDFSLKLAMLGAVLYLFFRSFLFLSSLVFKVFLLLSKEILDFQFLFFVKLASFMMLSVTILRSSVFKIFNHLVLSVNLLKFVCCFFDVGSPKLLTLPLYYALDGVTS